MTSLNPCRCGNRPEVVTQLNGLVRISCVLARCNEIVCARPGMALRAWNEINPLVDEEKTRPQNAVPTRPPSIAAEPDVVRLHRGLMLAMPLEDEEIEVTVELPEDERKTDPTGGVW